MDKLICCLNCLKNNGLYDYCTNSDCRCHHEELKHLARDEMKPEDLKRPEGNNSGRYTDIGFIKTYEEFTLIDKVIYPVNKCPHCQSEATFHRRVQVNGDVTDNIWRTKQPESTATGRYYAKFDFCFDCHREFMMELYIYKKTKEAN